MSFKEGDIVEAAQDIGIVHLVPKGTVGIVTRRSLPGNVYTVEFFRHDGYVGRTLSVLDEEIKKYEFYENPRFVTKEEFLLSAARMETSINSLQNKIKALEAKVEKEEVEPLLKVGDVVEIPKDVLLGAGGAVRKGQKLEVLAVDKVTAKVVVYADVYSLRTGSYSHQMNISLSQDQVKKVEEPCPKQYFKGDWGTGVHPLAEESLKALSALYDDTLELMPAARQLGTGGEWMEKVAMVGDMIKQLKKAFSNS